MQLHTLSGRTRRKRGKRVGRGGKRGTTAGRGTKGQKARAGHRIRPALRDVMKQLPKQRGYRFRSISEKPRVVMLSDLEERFESGARITPRALRSKKLLKNSDVGRAIKILGTGAVTKAFTILGMGVSAEAEKKIRDAGGDVLSGHEAGKEVSERKRRGPAA